VVNCHCQISEKWTINDRCNGEMATLRSREVVGGVKPD
jgi:hypothetical protein